MGRPIMALVVRDNTSCIPQGLSSPFVSSKRVYFEPGGYLQTYTEGAIQYFQNDYSELIKFAAF